MKRAKPPLSGASQPSPQPAGGRRSRRLLVLGLIAAGVTGLLWQMVRPPDARKLTAPPSATSTSAVAPAALLGTGTKPADQAVESSYAGSQSCRECHQKAYDYWKGSHHALAERPVDLTRDLPVFYPPRSVKHGTQVSEARYVKQRFEVVTLGPENRRGVFPLDRVLGEDPLRQFLVAFPGGRHQVTEIAADPRQKDWFDIFGEEDRRAGEWGHWTGRGMTWNSMCAACHNTRVRKNYDAASDSYRTRMVEMGVGCEACHGGMSDHVIWQKKQPQQPPIEKDPTLRRFTKEQWLWTCGSCHARRTELTGDYIAGEHFLDHHGLVIPDETDLYYPDGQVREEDYEYTSFLGSRMFASGVYCGDCHEPHSSRTFTTDNALCLRCHSPPIAPAPKIVAAEHTFHKPGESGDKCVDCHMPQTVYMMRHWRHDHGFTIPDPLLTKEHGIPNACNRCHKDKTVDWAIEAAEKWYGKRLDRPTRARARYVAQARAGARAAIDPLLKMVSDEKVPLWRAVAAALLKQWAGEPTVTAALLDAALDADPLVRAFAARGLETLAGSDSTAITNALSRLREDAVRMVRIEAGWVSRRELDRDLESRAARDLMQHLEHNRDQPSGLLQLGVFHLDRGDLSSAIGHLRKAVRWDGASTPLRQALAVALSLQGRSAEAVGELEAACRLTPRDPELRFKLGLALNEVGKLAEAIASLEEAVKLEPRFTQAWYNLGLACAAAGRVDQALEALIRAESLDVNSPHIPYARATILARQGRIGEARTAVRRALEIQPGFAEAAMLLEALATR